MEIRENEEETYFEKRKKCAKRKVKEKREKYELLQN